MRRSVSILTATAATLLLAAPAAMADDNPDWHGKCSARVSPTEANYADGWVNVHSDGNNWKIVNIYANLRNVGGRIGGDNEVTVQVNDFSRGGQIATWHTFKNIANADLTLTADVYPAVSIPKGKVGVRVFATTNMSTWPKRCDGTGLVF